MGNPHALVYISSSLQLVQLHASYTSNVETISYFIESLNSGWTMVCNRKTTVYSRHLLTGTADLNLFES